MKQVQLKLLLSFLLAVAATAQYGAIGNAYGGSYGGLSSYGGLNAIRSAAPVASYGQALAVPAAPSVGYSAPAAPVAPKVSSNYGAQADTGASTGYATTSYSAPASYASSNTGSSYGSSYGGKSIGKSVGYGASSGKYGGSYAEPTGPPYGIQSTGEYSHQYYEEPLDLSRCGPTPAENPCTLYGAQYYPLPGYPHCYIQCAFERMFVKPCPANLVWNSYINVCDWPTVASYGASQDQYGSSSYGSSASSYGRKKRATTERKKRFITPVPPLPFGAPLLPFGLPGPIGFPGPLGFPGLPGPIGMPTPFIYPVDDDDYSDYDDYSSGYGRGGYGKSYKKNKKYGTKSYGNNYNDNGYGDSSYSNYDSGYSNSNKYSKSNYKRNGNFKDYGMSKRNDYSDNYYRKKRDYGSTEIAVAPVDKSFVVLGRSQLPLATLCAGASNKGNLPHPSDSTKYIACLDENTQEIMDCPEGLVYIRELDRCEKPQSSEPLCESQNPCQNDGQCYQDGPSTLKCTCRAAWTGEFCETPVSSCASNPCGLGNTCHTLKAGDYKQDFVCVCDEGLSYGLGCDRNTVPNPCRVQSGEIELYHPFAFSAGAFVQCEGEILHVQPCAAGLVWSQVQKGCRPIDFVEPQFDSLPSGQTQNYGAATLITPMENLTPVVSSYSTETVTFQTPVIPANNYGATEQRVITMKTPSSYGSSVPASPIMHTSSYGSSVPASPMLRTTSYGSFAPASPMLRTASYGSFAPASPMLRTSSYGQQTFIPSNPIVTSSYGSAVPASPIMHTSSYGSSVPASPMLRTASYGSSVPASPMLRTASYGSAVPASPMLRTSSYGQQTFVPSNPIVTSSYGSAVPASPVAHTSSYGEQTFVPSNPIVTSSYGSAVPASPVAHTSSYGQQSRTFFTPQIFKRVINRVFQPEMTRTITVQPESSGY